MFGRRPFKTVPSGYWGCFAFVRFAYSRRDQDRTKVKTSGRGRPLHTSLLYTDLELGLHVRPQDGVDAGLVAALLAGSAVPFWRARINTTGTRALPGFLFVLIFARSGTAGDEIKIRIKVKGSGRGRPLHMGRACLGLSLGLGKAGSSRQRRALGMTK